jgi:butyryl-CoA dehydrogenase
MKDFNNKVAIVTGAGSGIGRSLAQQLAVAGCRLALTDVRGESLEQTKALLAVPDEHVLISSFDVSEREAMESFADAVVDKFGQVDIVINNAGVGSNGFFEEQSYDTFRKIFAVNMWGVIYGTRAFLPQLKKSPESSLVNVSSINGMVPFPLNGPYNMSKYAVLGLNETLMMELKDTSVQILSVHPGTINTNIANFGIGQSEQNKKAFAKAALTTPEQAAAQIIKAIKKKKSHVFVGPDAKLFQLFKRISAKLTLKLTDYIIRDYGSRIGK